MSFQLPVQPLNLPVDLEAGRHRYRTELHGPGHSAGGWTGMGAADSGGSRKR